PLYFFETDDLFAFASEIKSFLLLPEFRAELNDDCLDEYMLFRNMLDKSLLKGVVSVEPGTYRTYTPDAGFIVKRYFDVNQYQRNNHGERGIPDVCRLLGRAVQR